VSDWQRHLVVLPIVLPLAVGALMLLFDERRVLLKAAISVAATIALLAAAIALLVRADTPVTQVYRLGDWPAPFGIVLVADRLSALMVLLASVIGLAALIFGRYTPVGAFGAALLFGAVQSMQLAVRISPPAGDLGQLVGTLPPQWFGMAPYIFTIIVLAGVVGRTIVPAADGIPYDKESRA